MAKETEQSFENAIKRLEEIVHLLEEENPSLEDALKLFEEGKTLIGLCQNKLDNAEQKLKILTEPDR